MLTNIHRALTAYVSIRNLHVIVFIKNYTDISRGLQRELLDCSASVGEVDGLRLILNDLYVPALTPRFH
jgi:hypothetical protein